MPASGVDDNVKISFFVCICLYKMIAATKRAEVQKCFSYLNIFMTVKGCKIKVICKTMRFCSNRKTSGNIFAYNGIKFLKLNFPCLNLSECHTAAYIDSNEIWKNFIADCHGQTDSANLAGMNVRHNTNDTSF